MTRRRVPQGDLTAVLAAGKAELLRALQTSADQFDVTFATIVRMVRARVPDEVAMPAIASVVRGVYAELGARWAAEAERACARRAIAAPAERRRPRRRP